MAAAAASTSQIPPLTPDEEDTIIHSRITNDEKVLKKVVKRFHNYASVAFPLQSTPTPASIASVDDARENFLIELASFHLSLKKAVMVCEAESRQVDEYEKEQQKIANERHGLKGQIEQLKTSLEDAQLLRRRKIEYDQVAEKINVFPTREELQQSIDALENDIVAIRSEHENQHRVMQSQKSALDSIISDIGTLRLMGKDTDMSRAVTPSLDGQVENGEGEDKSLQDISMSTSLSVFAKPFAPPSRISTPIPSVAQRQIQSKSSSSPLVSSPALAADKSHTDDDDIEMGELAEEPRDLNKAKKKVKEDLEEGEASDSSSELSDVPDDV